MSTPQTAPTSGSQVAADTGSPNQYHLHGADVEVTYYPTGAGSVMGEGPIILMYQDDAHGSLVFRGTQAQVVPVAGLGTCVTVTLQQPLDSDWATATLLIPTVVLAAGQPATVHTELISTVHSVLSPAGDPQRDRYTVSRLTGQASQAALPG